MLRYVPGLLIALIAAHSAEAQFVPPVPKGIRGDTVPGERPIPIPDPDQKWIRATSPNFVIISSAPEARTREIAELLETVARALRQVHPRFDARFSDTTVFLFHRRRDSQPYFELLLNQKRTGAPGAFVSQPDGTAAMIVDSGRPLSTDRTVKHELMHNILAASGTRLPLWLEEGIAEYFSTTSIRGDHVVVGRPIVAHQMTIRARGTLPMEEVMAARAESPVTKHVLFYPQSWAVVDWMMRASRPAFYAFVAEVEKGADVSETFRKHFSMDAAAVARAIRAVFFRPSAASATQIERTAVPVSAHPIQTADALYELARFLGRMNRTRDDAEVYLRSALQIDPKHARATAAIGTLRSYDRKFDESFALFEQALAIDADDPAVQLSYAEALLRNAIGPFAGALNVEGDAPARFRRARALATAALAIEPSPLAEAIVGTTYLADDDVTAGIDHLTRARSARPGRVDFALNLYALYLRADRRADADALFASSFQRSRNPQAGFAARTIFVREYLRKANRLIDEDRLEEASALVKSVAEITPDATAKNELLSQAVDLARLADSNRQIIEYNKAVTAFNKRQNTAALEILETLLASATDDAIRDKAERLRSLVRKRAGGM